MTVLSNRAFLFTVGSALSGRSEIGDDVGAVHRIAYRKPHLLSGNECVGAGEPLVERRLVPDDRRVLERLRIVESRRAACLSPEQSPMGRTRSVVFQRMAARAAALV